METENILGMLFGQMDERQQLCFKQAIVAQTIHYVSQRLPVADRDQGERSFVALANKWITAPTQENVDRAASSIDKVKDCSDYFLSPVQAAGAETGYAAIIYALTAAGEFQLTEAKQWQLATAWDILADRNPPPFEQDF
jgi:hypothetical protein